MFINQYSCQSSINFGSKAGRELIISGGKDFAALEKLQNICMKNGETPLDIYIDDALKEIPSKLDTFSKNLPEGDFDELDAGIFIKIKKTCEDFTATMLSFSIIKEEAFLFRKKMNPILQKINIIGESHGGSNALMDPKKCTDEKDLQILEAFRTYYGE